jgi:DNA-binding NarL/FixJ family response regulator
MMTMAMDSSAGSLGPSGTVEGETNRNQPTMRIVLAEDELLLREGMASLLERSGFEVVGQAGDAAQLLALVGDTTPDLVVVDIRMPPTRTREGLEAAREIRQQHPDIGILVLSAHAEVEHAVELLASGRGIGYLLKSRVTDVTEFVDTLERIAKVAQSSTRAGARARLYSPAH